MDSILEILSTEGAVLLILLIENHGLQLKDPAWSDRRQIVDMRSCGVWMFVFRQTLQDPQDPPPRSVAVHIMDQLL